MPDLKEFLTHIDAITAEAPSYKLGGDGGGGECDCIGLIIGAIRRSGGQWTGIHGSNYAARNEMSYLLPVTDAEDLNVGEVVYKAAMPGQTNYALPSRYAKDPDQRDYYHVGVVRSTDPLRIVHCTSPGGITTDTKLGRWAYHGWLKQIDQVSAQPFALQTAIVTAASGSTVNLRRSRAGALVKRVPVGSTVTVLSQQNDWCQVAHNGVRGWMKACYLSQEDQTCSDLPTRLSAVEKRLDLAEKRLAALDGGLG